MSKNMKDLLPKDLKTLILFDNETRRERVQVVVRCRPLHSKEKAEGRLSCVSVDTQRCTIQVRNTKNPDVPPKLFTFDRTYGSSSTQREVYDDVAHSIVHSVMCGYNGTILAYGQTASGKTFTMDGLDNPPEMRGIIPNAFEDIFAHIEQSQSSDHFLVRASYLEIYNEEIRDLLAQNSHNPHRLELKESGDTGVYVKNLTSVTVQSVPDINRLLSMGKKNRSVGATLMNQDSSRSHSIFSITVETSAGPCSEHPDAGQSVIRVGKLNLVDLAGSERLNKTGATGDRFRELTNINWSLSALGNVISALVDGKSTHIPYRDSKLTRLLQDSLGGNTRTVMIANIGPADYNFDESISTLRYANRAKNIKNKPRINEDPKDAILREFQEEIIRVESELRRLRAQLQMGFSDQEARAENSADMEKEMQIYKDQIRQNMEWEVTHYKSLSEQALACIKADLERKAQQEMEALKAEKERTEEEKQKIAEKLFQQHMELQSHYQALAREKEDREVLAQKLKALEEKLLHGSNTVSEKLSEKAKELALREQQIREKEFLDDERQRKIAELEESQLMVEEKCSTMEEDVEVKTRKLKKLMARYQQSKAEIANLRTELQDTIHEFQRERADMFLSLRSLDQQLQLKSFIIEKFIPPEEISKIMRRAVWDEESETWILQSMVQKVASPDGETRVYLTDGVDPQPLQRPASAMGRSRYGSRQAEDAPRGQRDPRYLSENIWRLELDMPERTTYDYDNPIDRARAETDVELALMEFEEESPYFSYNEPSAPTPVRPKSARTKHHSRPKTAAR
ncbi:hypothetical protein R1sor_005434 [Riccia sorocarpa]|uniref:Kinesin-like protein n=1 Tax=Riccia sorocarpa TaxID=122646 RepID=A0ABD3HK55_9MARC